MCIPGKENSIDYKVYEVNTNLKTYLPYVVAQSSVSEKPLTLLIDTGASLCILKKSCLIKPPESRVDVVRIKGIDSKDPITSHGSLTLDLSLSPGYIVSHKFHIFDNLGFPYDGIIGNDLFVKNGCRINYDSGMLEIAHHHIKLSFNHPSYTIEPRTETIIECLVQNPEVKEGIILDQHICDKLLVANSIVKVKNNNRINVSILNVSEKPISIDPNLSLTLIPITKNEICLSQPNANCYERTNEVLKQLRTSHLNSEESEILYDICSQYADIFHLPDDELTSTSAIKHEIKTSSSQPINVKSYRFPEVHKDEVRTQIGKMLEQNIIKPSTSPWSSPIWIVPKKVDASGKRKWRIVIDYRKLNDVTIGESYPIPQINEILDQLGNSKYFTTLDLASGFHQIEISDEDVPKTAFSVPEGHYEFIRMPFGLKNAPATFQRLMNTVLSGLQGIHCYVYLDDIVIYSYDLTSHVQKLSYTFDRLRKFNLKLQPDKCEFLRKEVTYLGHTISETGLKPNPEKIKAVSEFPVPKCAKDVKSFLGLVSYYRRFLHDFSKLAKPLTSLLKKDIPFDWTNSQQLAFETLKNNLTSAPVLIYPDFTKPFILTCDASNYAISAILSQGEVGKDRPIAFASRTLNKAETNYSVTEKECLAIIFGTKIFRPYLYGHKFKILTDHRPLRWLFNCKEPGSKLVRWRLRLEEFDYEIEYKKGKINSNADALSRYPVRSISLPNTAHVLTDKVPPVSIPPPPPQPEIPPANPESPGIPEIPDLPDFLDLPENVELPDDLELPEDFDIPTPPEVQNDDDTYTKCLKEINNKSNQFDTIIHEHSENLLKTKLKTIIIPTSIDLDESNHYISEVIDNLPEPKDILKEERTLHSFLSFENNNVKFYLLFVKVYHFDQCNYEDIFKSLKNLKLELINKNTTEFAMTDFRNPFDSHSFMKIHNIITYLFHSTSITAHIFKNTIIYPSPTEITKILKENHDIPISGHLGSNRMLSRIQEKYYWRNMRRDVENYVRKCNQCQTNKALRRTNRAPMQITTTSTQPFERVSLDIVGPLPESGTAKLRFILTIQDDLTKFSAGYPIRNATAEETAECLIHFISHFGIPKTILTDQGTNFTADLFKQTCNFLKIKQLWSSPYHPQTQGALERSHATLKEYLKSFVDENQNDWPRYVYTAMLTYNTTIHCTTNYTPYELLFGCKPFIPTSIYDTALEPTYPSYVRILQQRMKLSREKAVENILKSKISSKDYYDRKTRPMKYKTGDMVYIKHHPRQNKALLPIWKGPHKVIKINGNNTLTLLVNRRHVKYHYDELKLAETTNI